MNIKVPNSAITKMVLGDETVLSAIGSMVMADKSRDLPKSHDNLKKYFFSGIIITDTELPIDSDWHMMECEIIIIPKKLYKGWKLGGGYKFSQILLNGYANAEKWNKEIKL